MGAQWELPGYDVEQLVGFGGSGEVWRARERASGDVVALKRMHACDAVARERLRREAAVLSSVAGEHVVRMRDVVVTDTDAVLVMDYAAGGNLATILAVRGRLAAPEVVTLVGPLAMALADAHERGLVHGDVTPGNVVFTGDGRPLLADFGVARAVGSSPGEPSPGEPSPGEPSTVEKGGNSVEGTPSYVAPEVAAGAPPGPAADVFALCRVASDALTRDTAPRALVDAIDAGLAEDPHDRPAARDLAMDVLRACAAAPVGLVRAPTVTPTVVTAPVAPRPPAPVAAQAPAVGSWAWPRVRLPQRLVVTAVAVAAVGVAVAGGVMWGHRNQSSAAVLPAPAILPAAPAVPATPATPSWLAVVTRLDLLRADAFVTGSQRTLGAVYAPAAAPLAADRTTLRGLLDGGLSVRGYTITATSAAPLRVSAKTAVLRVSDAISAYQLVDRTGRVVRSVPPRPIRSWTLTLTRVDAQWRIAAISR